MTPIQANVELIRTQAKVFQAVIDMAALLGDLGSVEQATQESKMILANAQAAVQSAEDQLTQHKIASEAIIENNQALQDSTRQTATEVIEAAQHQATQLIANAETKAATCIADQQEICALLTENATALQLRCDNATEELITLEAKLADARSKIADLLGR